MTDPQSDAGAPPTSRRKTRWRPALQHLAGLLDIVVLAMGAQHEARTTFTMIMVKAVAWALRALSEDFRRS